MLCICLSCCAPSRRAQQTHKAALGSPASIQHLLSLPARTLQHWMGDAWSSCFVSFNHCFRIWSVRFWVKEKSSESSGLAQCGDVALMRHFPPSPSHTSGHWGCCILFIHKRADRYNQTSAGGSSQTRICIHDKIWFCNLLILPKYYMMVKSRLMCVILLTLQI